MPSDSEPVPTPDAEGGETVGDAARVVVVGAADRETGGVAQYVNGLVERLADTEFEVRKYSTSSPPGKPDAVDPLWQRATWTLRAVVSAALGFLAFAGSVRGDLVHVHASSRLSFYRESLYVLFATRVLGVPAVLHVHGSDFDEFLRDCGPVRARYVRGVLDECATVVVLSPHWAEVLATEAGVDHTAVVPNPVDFDAFPRGDGQGRHVVYVSNLVERKGVREFVAAVERLLDSTEDVRVSVAGDGPEAGRVRALADDREAVTYLGYVSEERKRDLLAAGSVYVLPTYAEGLPIALLEGMAGGNAVVSTTVGAIPEVVGAENGILVDPVDVDQLADALRELCRDAERRRGMARANRRLVAESYTWERVTSDLRALYRGALGPRPSDGRAAGRTRTDVVGDAGAERGED